MKSEGVFNSLASAMASRVQAISLPVAAATAEEPAQASSPPASRPTTALDHATTEPSPAARLVAATTTAGEAKGCYQVRSLADGWMIRRSPHLVLAWHDGLRSADVPAGLAAGAALLDEGDLSAHLYHFQGAGGQAGLTTGASVDIDLDDHGLLLSEVGSSPILSSNV
jgi:hypothetical protein